MVRLKKKMKYNDGEVWTLKEQKVALEWKLNQIFGDRITIGGKDYNISIVVSDSLHEVYVKMIYDGVASVDNLNDLFVEVHDKLFDVGYRFYGIREYKDNHEVCVYYVREAS